MPRPSRSVAPLLTIISSVLLALILVGVAVLLLRQPDAPTTNAEAPPADSPSDSRSAETTATQNQIAAIMASAREGQVGDSGFTVGQSTRSEVEQKWQSPERMNESGGMAFAEYPQQFAVIGYRDGQVTDLRSDAAELHRIRYLDILDELGDADSVRTYADDAVDQIILGYDLPGGYTLRWVLPKPWADEDQASEASDNPALDHISLIASTQGDASDDAETPDDPTDPPPNADDAAAAPQEPSNAATPASPAAPAANESTEQSDDALANMTLDDKIGQMVIAGVEGTSLREEDRALLRDHGVGGVILYADNIDSAAQTKAFVAEIKAANPDKKPPLFVSVDQEGGRVARLKGVDKIPTAGAVGERNDAAYARSIGEQLGDQLLSQGFNLDYAPVLDVNSNPDNPVIGDRSFGNSAALVSKLGIATLQGLESKNVIPVVKHFPGHGDTSVDSHIALPVVNKSLDELNKLELIPFKKAIGEGADVMMIAHILLPKLDLDNPSSLSKAVITDLLRDRLKFDGVVMTDDMTMGAITENYGLGEASVRTVQAGSDIVLVAHGANNAIKTIEAIEQAVASGKISEQRIDESVARILALKQKYLMND